MRGNMSFLLKGLRGISEEVGIISHTVRLPRMHSDPRILNYGIWPSDTTQINGEKFEGRSGASGVEWATAILSTLGETFERYAPAFFTAEDAVKSSFNKLNKNAINPSKYALFHPKQYEYYRKVNYNLYPFTNDLEVTWVPGYNLIEGKEVYIPAQFIYMPFKRDKQYVTAGNSTGLAAHTNLYAAILNALYEVIERDSFVMTWMNNLVPDKIVISEDVKSFIDERFPHYYEWHFFDITYDLKVPTTFGICKGRTEYGSFIAVGSATRGTFGDSLRRVIMEIGQTVPYFRWLLEERKDWEPDNDFNKILTFSDHSIFYLKRKDLWHVFDEWINEKPTKSITFNECSKISITDKIRQILKIFSDKKYSVVFKNISTPDIRQLGYYAVKIFVPELLQLSGGYPFYFLGGKRLYEIPRALFGINNTYETLNKYPHPFP